MIARELLPHGVHVLERGWLSSNNVVFSQGEAAVVDTGYATHAVQTIELINRSLRGAPLRRIVTTHLHSDHCGGNAMLQAAYPAADTFVPAACANAVATWDEEALTFRATGQQCPRFTYTNVMVPGDHITLGERPWEVHGAPGHDPHAIILFEPASRVLISADALWENGFGVVFPELDGEDGFIGVQSALDCIERLHPAVVIPGHGSPFAGAAVDLAVSNARRRLARLACEPKRHAEHALKVLIKFRLLEIQSAEWDDLLAWASDTPYIDRICHLLGTNERMPVVLDRVLSDLERQGALRRSGRTILNS